jgi:Rrf2 family iron-sulfur cluster assembly transcriptional regulator
MNKIKNTNLREVVFLVDCMGTSLQACLPLTESEQIMRLSTQGRFAVCAMMDVALREQLGPVSLSAVGVRQHISLSYLEQMFSKLRRQGLVKSTRGPGGGYGLGRSANAITVADIIDAVQSKPPQASTDRHLQGVPMMPDLAKDLWDAVNLRMRDYLQSITLRALVDEQRAKGVQISERLAAMRGIFAPRKENTPKRKAPNSVFALAECG